MKASLPLVFSAPRSAKFFTTARIGSVASLASLAFGSVVVTACGGAPPAQTPVANASDTVPVTTPSATPVASSTTTTTTTTTSSKPGFDSNAPYVDAEEFTGTKSIAPLLSKSTSKSAFPEKTIDEGQCWGTVNLSGKHMDDYTALTVACGPPGGLLPYINPVSGKLHSVKDSTDVYSVKLLAGTATATSRSPTTASVTSTSWSKRTARSSPTTSRTRRCHHRGDQVVVHAEDQTYEFHVKIDGEGTGAYELGIWARPQGKGDK